MDTEGTYRDSISTVNSDGKRAWIYPKKPSGRFYSARTIVSWFLIAFLVGAPFIKVDGHPLFLLNLLERKFIIFGLAFGPHDFFLFVLAFIAAVIFIVLFTAIFGRVFCGWACPQTIFMEMVFRKIEYLIEGDANQQRKLNAAPWTASKVMKKTLKLSVFFALSFGISNVFLSWIIGVDELYAIITAPPSRHLTGLFAITLFSGVFFFVFSWFREQACTIVCPYGRLQGVLLDRNSLVVAYDPGRGEPRGKMVKGEQRTNGDCIDCALCVDVCPTGIDIRNGIQLECVSCTACIDACDNVMDKINKPRGLVRYGSLNGIEKGEHFRVTPRIVVYSLVLVGMVTLLTYLLATRTDFGINVLRTPGMMFQEQPGGKVSNLYNINMVNKTFRDVPTSLKLKNANGEIKMLGGNVVLKAQQVYEGKFLVVLNKADISTISVPLEISVIQNGKEIKVLKTSFLSHLAGGSN